MASINYLINKYRQILPKNVRRKIPPKLKNKVMELLSSGQAGFAGLSSQQFMARFDDTVSNLLKIYASTQEKRMLMIVGNIISVDSRVLKSAKSMQDAGFHVVLIGMKPAKGKLELTNFGSIPALILDSSELRVSSDPELLSLSMAAQLEPIIQLYDPTHVYSHDFFGLAFVSDSIAALNQTRYCHWTHDIHEYVPGLKGAIDPKRLQWAQKLEEQRLSVPDNIIVVNEKIRDLMAHMFSPHQRIDVLHNVPRHAREAQFNLREACNISTDKPLAVYTGRATELRGLDVIIPALAAIPDLNIALLSEGSKPYLDTLKARAEEKGAVERLHIFPYLPDAQVSDGIKSADFGIAPFRKYGNTELALPTKLFEYTHAGLPVVASDCMEMKRFIAEYGCGEVFQSENDEEFIDCINKVLARKKSSYVISKKKLEKFSWRKQYEPIATYMKATGKFDKSKRIFHGPGPSAGQPRILSAEMQSEGHEAYCVNIVREAAFGYEKDISFPYRVGAIDPKHLLYWAARRFGIFHFYFRTTSNYVTDGAVSKEIFQDVHILRALGCKVIMHFRGTEARVQSVFERKNPFAWSRGEDPFPGGDTLRKNILKRADGLFYKLLVTDPELQGYVENSMILQRAIDFRKIDAILKEHKSAAQNISDQKIRIAHAPSRRALKGTKIVLDVIQKFIDQGMDIELDVIEQVTNVEALKRMAKADLVIDQMRIGWYGVLAVEAMALGKPTIAYIRDDLIDRLEPDCPIIKSNPDSFADDLSSLLKDRKELARTGAKSRKFAKRYHCSKVVAKKAMEIYDTL